MNRKLFLLVTLAGLCFASASASVSLILPHRSGNNGTQITIPVKVKDFINIISVQGTIEFDPAVITYASVQDFGLPGMNSSYFGTTQVGTGKFTFSWYDGSLNPNTLADSSTLFSITFNILGTSGQSSTLVFSNTPTLIEIVNSSFNTETVIPVNGSVLVSGGGPVYDLSLYLDTVAQVPGLLVDVALRAVDFTNINSIQGTVKFDPAIATFSSISAFGLPGMNISNFGTGQVGAGKLMFSWNDGSLQGIDLPDHTPLFTISFMVTGTMGSIGPVGFASTPTLWEVTDSLYNTLNADTTAGYIRVMYLIGNEENIEQPSFELMQNQPNPFTDQTRIRYSLPVEQTVTFTIYDLLGNTLYEDVSLRSAGMHSITWNGTDRNGKPVANGYYFYRLQSESGMITKKMTLMK